MTLQINADLIENAELDSDALAEAKGGITFAPIMLAADFLWHRYSYGADSYSLPSGSTVYTNGGGDFVGIEDANTRTSYSLR